MIEEKIAARFNCNLFRYIGHLCHLETYINTPSMKVTLKKFHFPMENQHNPSCRWQSKQIGNESIRRTERIVQHSTSASVKIVLSLSRLRLFPFAESRLRSVVVKPNWYKSKLVTSCLHPLELFQIIYITRI